jgi:hypothetical protein
MKNECLASFLKFRLKINLILYFYLKKKQLEILNLNLKIDTHNKHRCIRLRCITS